MNIQKLGKHCWTFWFSKKTKSITINANKKEWPPRLSFHENGGRKKQGDNCFDCTLIMGTICMSYTNWQLQTNESLNPDVDCPACGGSGETIVSGDAQFGEPDKMPATCKTCKGKTTVSLTKAQEYRIKELETEMAK